MGAIRERMIEELELRGMSAATKKSYLICCRLFVAHFMKSPEQLGAGDIKAFLLNLMRERKVGPSCVRGYIAAISFLYRNVLRNPEAVEDLPYPRVPKTLPDVLSREEVRQLLGAVRSTIHRTILMVAYGAGLRISEALRLQVQDIDSKRMVIHIRGAKQAKDRFVLLSPQVLAVLRHYWVETKPRGPILFPSRSGRPLDDEHESRSTAGGTDKWMTDVWIRSSAWRKTSVAIFARRRMPSAAQWMTMPACSTASWMPPKMP